MGKSSRCLYNDYISSFINTEKDSILGAICNQYHGDLNTVSRDAWLHEIEILKRELRLVGDKQGQIIFEYDIPRLGKRIDVVLLIEGIIFCLEFKDKEKKIEQSHIDQVLDYALDLKYFHESSQDRIIVPILIPTMCKKFTTVIEASPYADSVVNPLIVGEYKIGEIIDKVLLQFSKKEPNPENWIISRYSPTPTIIEAAKRLYDNHSVENITRSEADEVTTKKTIEYILDIIKRSKEKREKSICFVTGVPGAGKTLIGLDVAVKQTYQADGNSDDGAVYLSGNGPLVAVLVEALAEDNYKKCKEKGEKKKKSDSKREVKKFIQGIHKYRDNMLAKIKNPVENGVLEIDPEKAIKVDDAGYGEVEHIAIFDEAQRSWTHERLADYLKRGGTYGNKIKVPNFPMSEASFLIWSLDQREDWATIICLVGGGQEIHTGEAGIGEWIDSLNKHFRNWKVYISPKLTDPEYAEGKVNELLKENKNATYADNLHLDVSLRSFRAEKVSSFVHKVLDIDSDAAEIYKEINDKYPIVLTRNIETAKQWLHSNERGTERTGILISKESARFKPLGVHVLKQEEINTVHWFLEDKEDTRSSNYLEDAATEIQVQGLELDYACVLWDADMRYENKRWHFYEFKNNRSWKEIKGENDKKEEKMKYMLNAYRVLLTRAREGMVICVPNGNSRKNKNGYWEDSTRKPEYYDGTYEYFKSLGIKEI